MNADAYGFLEVKGWVTGIEAADAMVKSAHVRLVAQLKTDPAFITLVVEGDIGACSAALDAGRAAALRVGQVVSVKLIGRPEPDIALFFKPQVPTLPTPTAPGASSIVPATAPSAVRLSTPPRRRKRKQAT